MKTIFQNKFEILFSLLLLLLPFSNAIPNIAFGLIILLFLLEISKVSFKNFSNSTKILILLLFFLIIKSLCYGFFIEDFSYYKFFLILIITPILFLKINNKDLIKKAAIIAINLSVLISIYNIVIYFLNYHYLPFNDGWAVNALLILERPYAGVFSLISIIISFELYRTSTKFRYFYFLSILISIFFIFLISARISIITLILLLIIYLLFYFKKKITYKLFLFTGIFLTVLLTVLLNKNLSQRFFIQKNIESTIQVAKASEPRVIIWDCAFEMIKSTNFNQFSGLSSYNQINYNFKECYGKSIENSDRKHWFLNKEYNSHNQFIHFYLIGGIIGFLLFFIFIVHSLFYSRNNFYGFSIILTLTLFLFVENLFERQFGTYIFIIFFSLYIPKLKSQNEKN